jgi:HAMP domain-containing protein
VTAVSRRSLRHRLGAALVGVSVGSVLLAGGIVVLAARPVARAEATAELRRGLAALAEADREGERPRLVVARLKAQLLATQVGVVAVLPDQTLVTSAQTVPGTGGAARLLERLRNRQAFSLLTPLPAGVRPRDLNPEALDAGTSDAGSRGTIVWVAQPLSAQDGATLVLIATRRVGFFALGGRLGGILLVAAAVAAGAAALLSVWLVRRLTRPLAAIERTAVAIAAGDLDARVGLPGTDVDDELAAVGAANDKHARHHGGDPIQ